MVISSSEVDKKRFFFFVHGTWLFPLCLPKVGKEQLSWKMYKIHVSPAGNDIIGGAVSPCIRGAVTLMRQKIFKGEPLIPVQPTRTVLVLFPVTCPVSLGPGPSNHELSALTMVAKYIDRLQRETSVDLCVVQCILDSARGTMCVVISLNQPTQLIDVLAHCDEARSIDPCNFRRAIAFPFDHSWETPDSENYFQLPACTMCLDRLERSISGLTLAVCYCEDATSCQCIMSCTCVVCQTFVLHSTAVMDERLRCTDCSARDDVWICLVCGYVGCSRYQAQHAKQHYQSTLHEFSLSMVTQQVWDYQADRYVHRLIVSINCETGKSERMHFPEREVMEFEAESLAKGGEVSKMLTDAKYDVKIEQCCAEYTKLLASQLALQREYYERQVANILPSCLPAAAASAVASAAAAATAASVLVTDPSSGLSALDIFHSLDAEQKAVSRAVRDWVSLGRAVATLEQELTQRRAEEEAAQAQLVTLKAAYMDAVAQSDGELAKLTQQVKDLQETISETQININAQKSIAKTMKGESMGGSMMVVQHAAKKERRRK